MRNRKSINGTLNVLVVTGSLRKDSLTLKMAKALLRLCPASMQLEIANISTLPLYNEDLETPLPPMEWVAYRKKIKQADGVLFITPEYNRSVPAVLKNAIDIGSAPHEENVYKGIPAAIISMSPGSMGAFGANHHLRQSLVFLDMPTMQQPEAYISYSEQLFGNDGTIIRKNTSAYLMEFMQAFERWIKLHKAS